MNSTTKEKRRETLINWFYAYLIGDRDTFKRYERELRDQEKSKKSGGNK